MDLLKSKVLIFRYGPSGGYTNYKLYANGILFSDCSQAREQNNIYTAGGFGLINIQNGTYGPFRVSTCVNIGSNSIYRTGGCRMRVYKDESSNLVVSVDVRFERSLLALGFPSVKMNGDDMSAVFRVLRNSYRIGYTIVKGSDSCRVRIDSNGYEELGDLLESWTSIPKYDRTDLSSMFSKYILPVIGEQIPEKFGNTFYSILSHFYCNPDVNISNPETVLQFLLS